MEFEEKLNICRLMSECYPGEFTDNEHIYILQASSNRLPPDKKRVESIYDNKAERLWAYDQEGGEKKGSGLNLASTFFRMYREEKR